MRKYSGGLRTGAVAGDGAGQKGKFTKELNKITKTLATGLPPS